MNSVNSIIAIIKQFNYVMNEKQKRESILMLFLIIIGSFFEMLGVSLIVPFVQAMLTPELLFKKSYIMLINELLNIDTSTKLIIIMGIFLILIYFIKNIYLTFLAYFQIKFQCKVQKELSVYMLQQYMKHPYTFFLQHNSGELIRGVDADVNGVYSMLTLLFRIIAEVLTGFMIGVYILSTNISMAVSITLLAALCLIGVTVGFKRLLSTMGKKQQKYAALKNQNIYQAINGAKEIKVMHRESYFMKSYEQIYEKYQKTVIINSFAGTCPERIIEAVCISGLIAMVCLQIITGKNSISFVPQLAAFAVAAFRILPSISRISSSFNQFIFFRPTLNSLYKNIEEVRELENSKISEIATINMDIAPFTKQLIIKDVTWKYPESNKAVLENINLTIERGKAIAFIGQSGAGKTTLANIILGLLKPQKGSVYMDDCDIFTVPELWAKMIGYVPQSVFLIDDTIRNNVAFGIEENEIDDEQIWNALSKAQLRMFVESLPEKLDTIVGERGVRFSGGQSQRVAIARALYYDPQILVLDEATSALDSETEKAIMEAIDSLYGEKTLIIVAHRLSTVRKCDEIYKVEEGTIVIEDKEKLFSTKN